MKRLLEPDAWIIVTQTTGTVGPNRIEVRRWYRWEGGTIARLDLFDVPDLRDRAFRPGQFIRLGALRLLVVQVESHRRSLLVAYNTRWAAWYLALAHIEQLRDYVRPRIIATLAIWGLARWNHNRILTWTDIHAVRWLVQRLHQENQP